MEAVAYQYSISRTRYSTDTNPLSGATMEAEGHAELHPRYGKLAVYKRTVKKFNFPKANGFYA